MNHIKFDRNKLTQYVENKIKTNQLNLKEFFNNPEILELIENNKFDELLNINNKLIKKSAIHQTIICSILLLSNIDFLNYMTHTNSLFMANNYIESVYIPDNIKLVGSLSFAYCNNLKSINLPNEVSLKPDFILNCPELKEIIYRGTENSFLSSNIGNTFLQHLTHSLDNSIEKIICTDAIIKLK